MRNDSEYWCLYLLKLFFNSVFDLNWCHWYWKFGWEYIFVVIENLPQFFLSFSEMRNYILSDYTPWGAHQCMCLHSQKNTALSLFCSDCSCACTRRWYVFSPFPTSSCGGLAGYLLVSGYHLISSSAVYFYLVFPTASNHHLTNWLIKRKFFYFLPIKSLKW